MLSLCLTLCALYVTLLLSRAVLALAYAAATRPRRHGSAVPTTIVQAILSGDPALEATLERNLIALPHCRFLWLVDADDAAAQAITHRLRERHAPVAIDTLVLPPPAPGHNPKIHKLAAAAPRVTTPHFVVLDDDTELPAASLAELIARIDTHELATGLPCYGDDGGLASRLLSQFVNNNAALTYLPLLHVVAPPSINGMGYALRVDTLARIGGFAPLARHLTDDLAVAQAVRARGGRLHQSAAPLFVQTSVRDLRHYTQLLHRWFLFALLLLRRQPPLLRAGIVLLHGLPPLLFGTALVTAAASANATALLAACALLLARAAVLAGLQHRLTGAVRHRVLASVLAELLQPLHALHALLVRRIRWRTRHYRVHANDDFEPV